MEKGTKSTVTISTCCHLSCEYVLFKIIPLTTVSSWHHMNCTFNLTQLFTFNLYACIATWFIMSPNELEIRREKNSTKFISVETSLWDENILIYSTVKCECFVVSRALCKCLMLHLVKWWNEHWERHNKTKGTSCSVHFGDVCHTDSWGRDERRVQVKVTVFVINETQDTEHLLPSGNGV